MLGSLVEEGKRMDTVEVGIEGALLLRVVHMSFHGDCRLYILQI